MKIKGRPRIWLSLFLVLVFAYAVFEAKDFAFAGRLFPLAVGILALILSVLQLVFDLCKDPKDMEIGPEDFVDIAPDLSLPPTVLRVRALRFLCWILCLYLGIWILGFKIAVPIFFISFLWLEGKVRWLINISLTSLSVYAIFYHFEKLLSVYWPKPLLSRWFEIPWLF